MKRLLDQYEFSRKIRTGIIGAGMYGTGIVTQASCVSSLQIAAIADRNLENAERAYRYAGVSEDNISICEDRNSALSAIESGKCVVTEDPMLLTELPIDVIVESTGSPEAGAHYAYEAIRHGQHVVMVTKEADVTVGPILKYLADKAGVIYTAADGDQHGLLMGLVSWARNIGLEVICGGKSLGELIYDPVRKTTSGVRDSLSDEELWMFQTDYSGQTERLINARREKLAGASGMSKSDVAEMTIAANATGLCPDVPSLHCPSVYTREIPKVLCHSEDGGILSKRGVIDSVSCLCYSHEAGLGGGVFIVVDSPNDYSRGIMAGGVPAHEGKGKASLITRPYHLRGVETVNTILAAALHGVATGASEYLPRYDVVLKAARDLKAGETLEEERNDQAYALMIPAVHVKDEAPLPEYMAFGNRLTVDVTKGTVITRDMVSLPQDSVLRSLRAKQDELFL